jgi:hypothetical protein
VFDFAAVLSLHHFNNAIRPRHQTQSSFPKQIEPQKSRPATTFSRCQRPLPAFIPLQHGTQHGGLAGSQACLTASYPSQPQLLSNCPSPILNPSCTVTQACLRPFSREKPYFRQISDSICILTSKSSLSIPRLHFRISFLPYPALLACVPHARLPRKNMLGPPGNPFTCAVQSSKPSRFRSPNRTCMLPCPVLLKLSIPLTH